MGKPQSQFNYVSIFFVYLQQKKTMAEFKLKPKTAEEWLEIITAPERAICL